MTRVLVAGAGNNREMPLRSLLEAGHTVGVVEHPSNIDASDAHFWLKESLSDAITSGSIQGLLDEGWDCFTVWGEYALGELERLRALTNLPGPELEPRLVRDKVLMRENVARTGVRQPLQGVCHSAREVDEFRTRHGVSAVVVKPRDGAGSLRVRYIEAGAQSEPILREAGLLTGNAFVCEEFVTGKEYSCELIVLDGACHIYGVTEKFQTELPLFYEIAEMFPAQIDAGLYSELTRMVGAVSRSLQVVNASMHLEFKISSGNLFLIEAAGRLAGDDIPLLVDRYTGINPYLAEIGWFADRQTPRKSQHIERTDGLRAFVFGVDYFPTQPNTPDIYSFLEDLEAIAEQVRFFPTTENLVDNEPERRAVVTGLTSISSERMRQLVRRATKGI